MKTITYNMNNLTDLDMTDFATKVKALMINSNNEITLAYSYNCYQFPGGTKEPGETLTETLKRELKEEVGLDIDTSLMEPIIHAEGYYKDWPVDHRNKKIDIYYYEVKTDLKPDLSNVNRTEDEKKGGFTLKSIKL